MESGDPFSYVGPHWTDLIWSYYPQQARVVDRCGPERS